MIQGKGIDTDLSLSTKGLLTKQHPSEISPAPCNLGILNFEAQATAIDDTPKTNGTVFFREENYPEIRELWIF